MNKKRLLVFSVFLFTLSNLFQSCVTKRNFVYFSNLPDTTFYSQAITNQTNSTIQPNDILNIRVATLNPDANVLYNSGSLPSATQVGNESGTNRSTTIASAPSYLVDADGNISFPLIGKIKVSGLTQSQAQDLLTQEISKTAKGTIVNVQIMNFRITVTGEVAHTGVFDVPNNKINIIEALALAGDMTPYSELERVWVFREKDGQRNMERLDMTDKNVFNNPYFYLKQNDIVYVQPYNQIKRRNSDGARYQWLYLISSSLGVISLLITLFRN